MPLPEGALIGPYQIVCLVGTGGMGEVYRARDTTLDRDVALKVLPELLAGDPNRLALFRREARVLASLNHPNIAHIHGIEESGAGLGLVMELVEGPTLADRLAKGAIPVAEVLSIARQVAEALESAHENGVIHRDLKPANIKVRDDGTVKVLDFGIAKALEMPVDSDDDPMRSPAFMATLTLPGALLGTAAYMSPEQARGKPVDRRTDIWAFGATVYEMLTGECLCGGDGISETLAAVLTRRVDWTKLPARTPLSLRRLLARCLDRDLKMRLRDIGEARIEIARIANAENTPVVGDYVMEPESLRSRGRRALPWIVAGIASAGLIGVLAMWAPWRSAALATPIRFAVPAAPGAPFWLGSIDTVLAISPDGTHFAYAARGWKPNLVVRAIDRVDAQPIAGVTLASQPFFSPDGNWIAFFTSQGELQKVPLSGGPPVTVCKFALPRGATWGPNGTMYVGSMATGAGLYAISETGGEPKRITTPDLTKGEVGHLFPFALPGGKAVLFTIIDEDVAKNQIAVLDARSGQIKKLFRGGSAAVYVDPGIIVYAASGVLRAIRFDLSRLETIGDSVSMSESVTMESTGAAQFGLAADGTLVYLPGGLTTRDVPRSLAWIDRQGHEEPIDAPIRSYTSVTLSPDGTRLALTLRDRAEDIWTWDLGQKKLERFTVGPSFNAFPIWTPDGRQIVFAGLQGGGVQNLFSQPAHGNGAPQRLTTSSGSQSPTTISPDGTRVLFREVTSGTGEDINMLTLSDGSVTPLFNTSYLERNANISPDGRYVAFEWGESGHPEIYVAPFPNVTAGRWQVTDFSTGNGTKPVWAPNGRELFFVGLDGIYSVLVQTSPSFSFGTPRRLFPLKGFEVNGGRYYDVSRDGRRFVVIKDLSRPVDDSAQLVVVVHWIDDVKRALGLR